MKDIHHTLTRIDREITERRQQIAYQQVEIARLEDTRRVLMGLAEADMARPESEPTAQINGANARPVLIVRRTGTGDEEGTASHAAKTGQKPKKPGSEMSRIRKRILALLTDAPEPMTSREIGDHLGIARGETHRKAMNNALYQLRVTKILSRDPEKRYSLPAGPPLDLDKAGRRMPRQNAVPMRQRLRSFLASAEQPMKANQIRMAMDIERHSLDDKLLGQSLSAMKKVGELTTDGGNPFGYSLSGGGAP